MEFPKCIWKKFSLPPDNIFSLKTTICSCIRNTFAIQYFEQQINPQKFQKPILTVITLASNKCNSITKSSKEN